MPRAILRLVAILGLALLGPPRSAGQAGLTPQVHDLIDRFFAPREFESLQLSPNGSHVAFYKEVGGRLVLATYSFKDGKLRLTDPDPGVEVLDFDWVGTNQLLFEYAQRTDPHPREHILGVEPPSHGEQIDLIYLGHWIVDADLKRVQQVPDLGPIYEMVDPLPQNPTGVLLAQQRHDNFYSPLYRYDPTHNTVQLIEKNPGRIVTWQTDVAGQVRLAVVAEKAGRMGLIYRENEQSAWQPLQLPVDTKLVTFDPGGTNLLVSFPDAEGRSVLQNYDLTAHQFTDHPIADPVYDLDPSVLRDPRTGAARGLEIDKDRPKIIWLDPQGKQLQALLAPVFPGALVLPIGATASGEILVRSSSDVSPTQYFLLEPKSGQLRLILDQRPKVRGLTLVPMQPVTFKSADGADLYGYLTLPVGHVAGRPQPIIALVHGGPAIRDSWGYDPEVQYYASLGYAVLQVNYRGSDGYGQRYALTDIIEVGQRSVDDVADGLQWAVKQGIADPKRIVVCGGSYGGFVALGLATRHPELPACVVGFAGVYDWENETRSDREKFRDLYKWATTYHPDLKENAARYREISPVHQAAATKAPVLLLHGRKDRRVDIAQSELMARALRTAGKSVEIVKDAEGVHGLPDEKLRRTYYERVTAFILKYAPPDTLP